MIQPNISNNNANQPVKAVGLISGGLDSTLAAKVVKDLGIDVYGVYFSMPWGCCDKTMAIEAAQKIGIKFIVLQLDERYLEMIRQPKHGYGTAMNPCVDCRIHMFKRAAQYMRHIGGQFVFTGEVLGQRPMSQKRHSMKWIERETGLEGRLLRPLCAQAMDSTIPETTGIIDREKLLNMTGRSRRPQIDLADQLGITEYNQPAGGCLLTDQNFTRRMRDTLDYGYRNFRETIALQWGRHFRIDQNFKVIVGRDMEENESLIRYAHREDIIMQLAEKEGPTLVLKGDNPTDEILMAAGGYIQRFSRYKNNLSEKMKYWRLADPNTIENVYSKKIAEERIENSYI